MACGRLPALRTAVVGWLVAGAVAIGLAAAFLGPFVELLPYANRVSLTQADIGGGLEPAFLMNILFRSSIVEPESYTFVGITVTVLIVLGASAKTAYQEKWWLLALFTTISLSLGTNTPLAIYNLLLRYVPIFQSFRAPGRWYPYAIFAAAVLAAWGYDKWSRGRSVEFRSWLRPVLIGLSLVNLGVSVSALLIPLSLPFRYLPQAFLLPIAAFLVTQEAARRQRIVLILVVVLDLWVVDSELISPQSEQALVNPDSAVSFLRSSLTDDERVFAPYAHLSETAPVASNLHTADGYDH
jgi:general stress protein CsbA